MNRRQFLELATAMGASLAWTRGLARESQISWSERRDLFPQGVASADPHADSVLLWTRRPPAAGVAARRLTLEVASDPEFRRVVASSSAETSAAEDWTCRVLAAGLSPRASTGIASSMSTAMEAASDGHGRRLPEKMRARSASRS